MANTNLPWIIVATTAHGKKITHRAKSRDTARKLRARIDGLPFIKSTTSPVRSA